ncbi:hypothetical protein ABE073_05150 [Lederbergia citrisecunda]|uniref:hypothetical protein n=1 Tax=Lederbergia citrisecunda TaxID=2833583 RepID=UPI003D2AA0E3
MKQHITPKQAKEVTEEQFYSMFSQIVKRDDWANYHHRKVTIGKMIDFLDGVYIYRDLDGEWMVSNMYCGDDLVDALWEATKANL